MMGGIAPPLPGRADVPWATNKDTGLTFGQEAGGAVRSYAEPIQTSSQGGMDPKAIKEAEAAVAAAMRFQGMRGFQQDVESGLTPDKAILKHGPKMFYNNPDGFALALHRLAATPETDTGPAQTVPALDASGVPVPGVHILRSANGFHVIHEPPSVENKQLAEGRKFRLGQVEDDLKAAKAALVGMTAASPRRVMAQAEVARLQQKAEELLLPTPTGGSSAKTIKVLEKKTGQKYKYPASLKHELSPDEFEVLQ